jgi:hypothetical protein
MLQNHMATDTVKEHRPWLVIELSCGFPTPSTMTACCN